MKTRAAKATQTRLLVSRRRPRVWKLPAYWFIIGEFAVSTLLLYKLAITWAATWKFPSFQLASAMVACQNATRELDPCESLPNSHCMDGCSSRGWVNFCDALPEDFSGCSSTAPSRWTVVPFNAGQSFCWPLERVHECCGWKTCREWCMFYVWLPYKVLGTVK